MDQLIIFDVGANIGEFADRFAEDPQYKVYLFEPTPMLLEKYLYPKQTEKYIIVPIAISDYDGEANFNIAGAYDWGCSSLNTFSEDLDKTWEGREDFKVTEVSKVLVRRIDTFMNNNKIPYISYLKIDAQGSDLKVLKSAGDYIKAVKGGQIEAVNQNSLYKEADNTVDNVITFLKQNDFIIDKIEINDPHQNEVNIWFTNSNLNYFISF